jgi:hypothetical protein
MSERRFLGVVEVDSGTVVIGDPSYLLARRGSGAEGLGYDEVLRRDLAAVSTTLAGRPVLLISGFGGDGTFPVFGEFDEGMLSRVTVEFVDPPDELS